MNKAARSAGQRALHSTFIGLSTLTVGFGVLLAASDPKYTWYAVWTFSDTGLLQVAAAFGFALMTAWALAATRVRVSPWISATVTAALFVASLTGASNAVRASMPMGNSEYIHFVPGTWSLICAWTIGAGLALAVVFLGQRTIALTDTAGDGEIGI